MTDFGKTQKVVIVEDNTALNDIYKTRLELLGYQVFSAYDGLQALQVIEREIPDLVLLDLMVPKKAGDQVLEEMRGSEWGKHIKVAIISNLNEADAPKGLRNLGIEAYAVKANLSNDQLDQLVDTILKPAGQAEDVLLAGQNHGVVSATAHDPSAIPDAHPASGISGEQAVVPQALSEYTEATVPEHHEPAALEEVPAAPEAEAITPPSTTPESPNDLPPEESAL